LLAPAIAGAAIALTGVWLWASGNGRSSSAPAVDAPRPSAVDSSEAETGGAGPRTGLGLGARDALMERGFGAASAEAAAVALERYVDATGEHDLDALVALARESGAEIEPLAIQLSKQALAVMPAHARPKGSEDWTDLDILRRSQYSEKMHLWDVGDLSALEVVTFEGPDVLTDELAFYRVGRLPDGRTAGVWVAPFRVADLERKLQQGEARGAVITFPLEGSGVHVSVLLGEYAPGKWWAVRHRTLAKGRAAAAHGAGES